MQIKWNKVTWYSRWAAVIVFLIMIPILCFYIGMIYGEVRSIELIPELGIPAKNTPSVSTTSFPYSTYSNDIYNFTFQYPSTWKVVESEDTTSLYSI